MSKKNVASRRSRLPNRAPRLTNGADVKKRIAELRTHYEPYTTNRIEPARSRFQGSPLNPWQFRYLKGGPRAGGEWTEIDLPEYKGRTYWEGEYTAKFDIPQELQSHKRLLLHFAGVETLARAWVNGIDVGSHIGGSDPFDFDITDAVSLGGSNEMRLEVANGLCVNGIGYERVFSEEPFLREGSFLKLVGEWGNMNGRKGYAGGVWRNVTLVGTAESWIDSAMIDPDPDNSKVALRVSCATKQVFSGLLRVEIIPRNFDGRSTVDSVPITMTETTVESEFSIDLEEQRWWSPDEPYLYTARISLIPESGESADVRDFTFGQRTFRYDDSINRYRLNGLPHRFRGTTTINSLNMAYMRGDHEAIVDQILLAKAAGFTIFRHHIMSPIEEVDDYLDMYGMLSQPEMPLWGRFHDSLIDVAIEQLPRIVRQHYNHPSTILFAISSESAMQREAYAAYQSRAIELVEREFPLLEWKIEGVRGNLSGVESRVTEWGNLMEYKPGLYDAHEYPGWYVNYGSLEPVRDGDTLMTIGEFGPESLSNLETMQSCWPDGSYPDDPDAIVSRHELPFGPQYSSAESRWFHPTPRTLSDWIEATQKHSAAVHRYVASIYRRSPSVVGYHQYFLNEPVWNTWRKTLCGVDLSPKLPYFAMARANSPVLIDLFLEQNHFTPASEISVRLFIANDSWEELQEAAVTLAITDPSHDVVWEYGTRVSASIGAPIEIDLPAVTLPPDNSPGRYELHAFVVAEGVTLSDDTVAITVMDDSAWPLSAPEIMKERAYSVLHFAGSRQSEAVGYRLREQIGPGYNCLPLSRITTVGPDWGEALVVVDGVADWSRIPTDRLIAHLERGGRILLREIEPGTLDWLVPGLSIVSDSSRALFRPDSNHPIFAARGSPSSESGAHALTAEDFELWNFVPVVHPPFRYPVQPYGARRTRDIVDCSIRFRDKEFNRDVLQSRDGKIRMFSVADADRNASALLEIVYGAGRVLICQAGVYQRYETHPVARILLHREIEFLLDPPERVDREKFDFVPFGFRI